MKFYVKGYKQILSQYVEYPVIVLTRDNWNDYGYSTLYYMDYYLSSKDMVEIGSVKILQKNTYSTKTPDEFERLSKEYCSLGQSLEYYEALKANFPLNFSEILVSLNDVAVNEEINDRFVELEGYNISLFRFSAAKVAFKGARMLLYENRKIVNENLSFSFHVRLEGASIDHDVHFDFSESKILPYRVNILVGKNGTGKTQFLVSLINSLSGLKHKDGFYPNNPLFDRVIAISYSLFDNFPKPLETTVFSYKYVGIRVSEKEIISDSNLEDKLKASLRSIYKDNKIPFWKKIISSIIPLDTFGIFDVLNFDDNFIDKISFKEIKRLSSGQSIILFIFTELIANIRYGSLILFDEPETHLHPSAIAKMINSFYDILNEFKSFAIISTHSPIITQDFPSKYITVFDRQGNFPIVKKLPLESFGENISILTSEIFNTIDVKELYKIYLEKMAKSIIYRDKEFENGLGVNASIYLRFMENGDNL